jgi:hypothetical protein
MHDKYHGFNPLMHYFCTKLRNLIESNNQHSFNISTQASDAYSAWSDN